MKNKCSKTLSGKHIFRLFRAGEEINFESDYYLEVPKCVACGMIDDLKKDRKK